jgi:TetR/AcrR family transcriptional repressor of nem operon
MTLRADQKRATRARILETAAAAVRERGLAGLGVAAFMAKAGLTHGGFYAHFASKDHLVMEAVEASFTNGLAFLKEAVDAAPPGRRLEAFVHRYLSPEHRDMPESGCTFAAIVSDVARLPQAMRAGVMARNHEFVDLLIGVLPPGDRRQRFKLAAALGCSMIGTLSIARVFRGDPRSDEILAIGRDFVLRAARSGAPAKRKRR